MIAFYAALHYTKAALLRDRGTYATTHRGTRDEHGAFHRGHNDLVRQHFDPDVRSSYKELFDRSQEARYRPFFRKGSDLPAKAQLALFRVHLEAVKAACI